MNKRNRNYIARYNPRSLFPLVDNKRITRATLSEAGIPMTELLGVAETQSQISSVIRMLSERQSFAIKPAKGSGGKGIMVIAGRDGDTWIKTSGGRVTREDLERHISNILSGLYSLGGAADVALIEDLIVPSDVFSSFSFEGVPDIRVIVCRGFPVMAMIRLSTHASDGKANLHQGAVGVGLDIGTGRALSAVQHGLPITHHPDTGALLTDLVIPDWDQLLELAARSYDGTGLGYMGIDIVIDANRGPLLLELNARPGLAIQLANNRGLVPRLKKIDGVSDVATRAPVLERVRKAKEWFTEDNPQTTLS